MELEKLKEELNQRLAVIETNIQQSISNYNVLLGGKQECLYQISCLEQKISEQKNNGSEVIIEGC